MKNFFDSIFFFFPIFFVFRVFVKNSKKSTHSWGKKFRSKETTTYLLSQHTHKNGTRRTGARVDGTRRIREKKEE
jgi:hypothetical protein